MPSIDRVDDDVPPKGFGVRGTSTIVNGVHGKSDTGDGVFGESPKGFALHGKSESGTGVHATSDSSIGVHGHSDSSMACTGVSGTSFGVHGHSTGAAESAGVYGLARRPMVCVAIVTGSDGVVGESKSNYGVRGKSDRQRWCMAPAQQVCVGRAVAEATVCMAKAQRQGCVW